MSLFPTECLVLLTCILRLHLFHLFQPVVKTEPNEEVNEPIPALTPVLPTLPGVDEDPSLSQEETSVLVKQEPGISPPQKKNKSSLSCLFGDVFIIKVEQGQAKSFLTLAQEEVQRYQEETNLNLDMNPFLWWKGKEVAYPLLSALTRHYLCIPGTSVPSERVFSTAGDIVTAQRSQLKWKHVDMMIFLKKNLQM